MAVHEKLNDHFRQGNKEMFNQTLSRHAVQCETSARLLFWEYFFLKIIFLKGKKPQNNKEIMSNQPLSRHTVQ